MAKYITFRVTGLEHYELSLWAALRGQNTSTLIREALNELKTKCPNEVNQVKNLVKK